MRKLYVLIALTVLLAGCGDDKDDTPPAAATAAPTEAAERPVDPDLAGYSQGVIDYYVEVHNEPTGDEDTDIETEYHQPPKPAEAGLGETITLTGTNIGVRLKVTVTAVERVDQYLAVRLKLANDGIAVYEAPLQNAALTLAGGETKPVVTGARATCTRNFDPELLRLDVGRSRSGCLLFEADDRAQPERFQLALEIVPTTAGGIWNLH
jgi:hypothetical protein